jgi:hypothetical protein
MHQRRRVTSARVGGQPALAQLTYFDGLRDVGKKGENVGHKATFR